MKVRRILYSLILSIVMVTGALTDLPVNAASKDLVASYPSGWDDTLNEPVKSKQTGDYQRLIEIDVRRNTCIYIGFSEDEPLKKSQLDNIKISRGDSEAEDFLLEPYSSGWDAEKNEPVIPDNGFFNIQAESLGKYYIYYENGSDTFLLMVNAKMPKAGIFRSDSFSFNNLMSEYGGCYRYNPESENVYYVHSGLFDEFTGTEIPDALIVCNYLEASSNDNENCSVEKVDFQTYKITIPKGQNDRFEVKVKYEYFEGEGYMYDGWECPCYESYFAFAPDNNGLAAAWEDDGYFREKADDYSKCFNDLPVKANRRLCFGWIRTDENNKKVLRPFEGTLNKDSDKLYIEQSVDELGNPIKGVYDVYAETSGKYTVTAENGDETSEVVIEAGLPRIGIYSSSEASEDTLICSEWDTLNAKKDETYYIIPTMNEGDRYVSAFDVEFKSELGIDNYSWKKSDTSTAPECSFTLNDEVDSEIRDAISCKLVIANKNYISERDIQDRKFNIFTQKEGFLVSDRWYEDDFNCNFNEFGRKGYLTATREGGVHLGIGKETNGDYYINSITDISKLKITDKEGNAVSEDIATIQSSYVRYDNGEPKTYYTKEGVYVVRIDVPGEYHLTYTDGDISEFVTLLVDDPFGGYYSVVPDKDDSMKGFINDNKEEKFYYDDDNRTFYFAIRPEIEIDDLDDQDPSNDVVVRKYVYGTGKIEERTRGNGEKYEAAVESDEFVLCRNCYDEENHRDVIEPITDENYAKIEKLESRIGRYEVYKVTLGEKYDGCGLMTRLPKKVREWEKKDGDNDGYSEEYSDDYWDDFWLNLEEKKTGLAIAWPDDGDAFPTRLDYFNKYHNIEIGEEIHLAAGFITEDGQELKVSPVTSDLSLLDDKGNEVDPEIAELKILSGGIFELSVRKCGIYRVAYKNSEKTYYATIDAALPKLAFYSSTEPSEETLVTYGNKEVFAEEGEKFYLCHSLNDWDINEINSIVVSIRGQDQLTFSQEDLKENRHFYTLEMKENIQLEMYFNWNDPDRHDQRMFNFYLSFNGLGAGYPGNEGVFDTNPNDYLQMSQVTMRCHEWRCFAIVSIDGEGHKTATPIAGTKENLDKFNITYVDGSALSKSDISYIQLIEENEGYKDGVFEVYLHESRQYRIYYEGQYVTVNSAMPNVSFTSEEGTYSEKNYSIIEEDPFSIGMGQVDEIDYYISTLDGSNTEEDGYYVNKITGIYVKEPKEPDENFEKYFTYKISDDGTSAKIHVDREVNLSEIKFGVTYDVNFYSKQDGNESWPGDDEFHIYIENDERTLVDLSEVKWDYTKAFEYDSEEKKVELIGLAEVVEVKYTDNAKTDIGKYTAKAELSIKEDKKETYKLPRPIDEKLQILEWEIVMPETIQAVIDSINDLPAKDKIKSTDKKKIDAAKAAYDKLTDDEKALIDANTVKKLTEAKTALEAIEKAAADKEAEEKAAKEEAEKKEAADKEAAEKFIKLINELPETSKITTNDEVKITVARTAYNALTTSQKNCVTADILKKLTDAETTLAKLKEKQPDPDKKAPKVGSVLTNKELKASYKVTKISGKNKLGEVGIYKVTSKTAKSFNIPKTIEVDGFKYSVTSIEINAFMGMSKLQKVSIPDTIIKIKNYAFKDCKALKSVTIPKKVTSIGTGVFMGCKKLRTVTFQGTSLKTIPSSAFSGCSVLNSIIIPQNVTSIGTKAFLGCGKLTKINIKSTKLKKVGGNAFKGINAKAKITVPKEKKTAYTKLFKKKGQPNTVEIK